MEEYFRVILYFEKKCILLLFFVSLGAQIVKARTTLTKQVINFALWNFRDLLFFFLIFQASLKAGIDLREAVKLPPSENMNDWLAVHGKYFIIETNLNSSTLSPVL